MATKTNMSPRKLYDKWCEGRRLTNKELIFAQEYFTNAHEITAKTGPVFKTASTEYRRVADAMLDCLVSRGVKSYD